MSAVKSPEPRFDLTRLPSLQTLHSFYVVSQTNSFTQAASELHLSQSAISRQIRQLEDHLNCTLFERHTRKVILSEQGMALVPVVEGLLSSLRSTFDATRRGVQSITVRMPPTFARRWFLPRLANFKKSLPDLDVVIDTAWFARPSFSTGDIDVLITYGTEPWPGMETVHLLTERLTPMCAPSHLPLLGEPPLLENLVNSVLLHSNIRHSDWTLWLNAEGEYDLRRFSNQVFDTQDFAFTAAANGYGVTMGDLSLVADDLSRGVLMAPFSRVVETGHGYFALYPARRSVPEKVQAFASWLESESAAEDQPRHPGP
ncbi:LysR substrate-binding domain-containing protein [Paracoccus seriniphilus]|uniref:LysR substrate-binding domain-containing protein n=1 Tax=Paracoccus seriniphilus TaxID=184748 RepID=UPI00356643D9